MKRKVGDKITVNTSHWLGYYKTGDVGVVVDVGDDGERDCRADFGDGYCYWVYNKHIKEEV